MPRLQWCARCFAEWMTKPVTDRKETTPSRAVITVAGSKVCADPVCIEWARAGGARPLEDTPK